MIRAVVFDLDGTLVQTERLKARSYAEAAVELRPELDPDEVVDAFKSVVGRSRRDVAEWLLERFDLASPARARAESEDEAPWETYVKLRLERYAAILADDATILAHRWPHALDLLECVRKRCEALALATMSHRPQVARVLSVLEIQHAFHTVATRDDVSRGKPDPEIYRLVLGRLAVAPREALAIEDSPSGVRAALAAGTEVLAVGTPFTLGALEEAADIPNASIVAEPADLIGRFEAVVRSHL